MSKMAILSAYRKKKFSSVPNFSNEARTVYLLPDAETKRIINRLESDEAKVGYLVRRAYFRAKGSFFPITMAELKDIRTAKRLLGINAKLDWDKYTSKMASYHRQLILEQCEWAPYSSDSNRNELEAHASLFVDKIPEREDILFALLDYCWRRRIEIPSYTELATIVSNSFSVFNDRLKATLSTHITQGVEETLHDLVLNPESIVKLKQLKSINQSTVTSHLNTAACELRFFKDLYFDVKTLAEKMNFTVEARQHFSKIVKDMTVTGLRKLKDKNDLSLKLLGFVEDQYIRRNDASILAFLKLMREWNNKAKKHDSTIKERESKALESATESVVNTAKSANAILNEIKRIMADIKMSDGERLTKIKDLLAAYEEATNPNINNYIEAVLTGVEHSKNNTRKMHFLYRNSIGIQRAVSPLLKLLLIDKENSDHKVTEAFEYFIESDGNVKEADAPVAFITTTDKVVMDTDKTTSYREKYKVMLFLALEKAIRAKKVNFLFSHSFQPAHKLQISDTLWKEKCEEFLKAAELLRFKDGEQVLTDVGEMTSNIIIQANKNLESGVNRYVSVRNGKWKLAEYEADFDTSQYIPGLLKGSKKVLLYKALAELDEELHFSDEFMIPNQIGALTKPDKKYIYGVLISLGTNMGHHELARASDLNEKALRDMDATRFTKKKLENVIKIIVKRIQNIDLAAEGSPRI